LLVEPEGDYHKSRIAASMPAIFKISTIDTLLLGGA
jgi:hypothetical protein